MRKALPAGVVDTAGDGADVVEATELDAAVVELEAVCEAVASVCLAVAARWTFLVGDGPVRAWAIRGASMIATAAHKQSNLLIPVPPVAWEKRGCSSHQPLSCLVALIQDTTPASSPGRECPIPNTVTATDGPKTRTIIIQ